MFFTKDFDMFIMVYVCIHYIKLKINTPIYHGDLISSFADFSWQLGLKITAKTDILSSQSGKIKQRMVIIALVLVPISLIGYS